MREGVTGFVISLCTIVQKRTGCYGPCRSMAERSYTPRPRSGAAARRSYPMPPRPRPGAAARRSNPTPNTRGGSWEDQPHVQGVVAVRAQEGLEELLHVEG